MSFLRSPNWAGISGIVGLVVLCLTMASFFPRDEGPNEPSTQPLRQDQSNEALSELSLFNEPVKESTASSNSPGELIRDAPQVPAYRSFTQSELKAIVFKAFAEASYLDAMDLDMNMDVKQGPSTPGVGQINDLYAVVLIEERTGCEITDDVLDTLRTLADLVMATSDACERNRTSK